MQRRLLAPNDSHEKLIMPGVRYFTVKNTCLEYINDLGNTAELLGFGQENDILGQTDYDIKTPAQELAHVFEQQDKLALRSKKAHITLHFLTTIPGSPPFLATNNQLTARN